MTMALVLLMALLGLTGGWRGLRRKALAVACLSGIQLLSVLVVAACSVTGFLISGEHLIDRGPLPTKGVMLRASVLHCVGLPAVLFVLLVLMGMVLARMARRSRALRAPLAVADPEL